MELRSNRSRSNTPFLQTNIEQEVVVEKGKNHIQESIVQHSYSTRRKIIRSTNNESSDVFLSAEKQISNRNTQDRIRHKTSDYSSEGENEITTSAHMHKHNGEIKSALQMYKEAGDYWNKYPKTDYTYSVHSRDRVELAPGVVAMPNMSRRSLRSSAERTSSVTTTKIDHLYNTSYDSALVDNEYNHMRRRYNLERKALFRDELEESVTTHVKVSFVRRCYRSVVVTVWRLVTAVLASIVWLGSGYYRMISRLLLFDTWLLQRKSVGRRRWGPLIALLFLPLLLFAGWWLWSTMQHLFVLPDTRQAQTVKRSVEDEQSTNEIVRQLLVDPEFEKLIARHASLITPQDDLTGKFADLNRKIAQVRAENVRSVELQRREFGRCCRHHVDMESYVRKLFVRLIAGGNVQGDDVNAALHSVYVAQRDLDARFVNANQQMHADLVQLVDDSMGKVMDVVVEKLSKKLVMDGSGVSDEAIKRIVKEALAVYDADKTGLVDYALEPSGGQIISTRCTETYNFRTAVLSILGFPIWYPSNSPRIVITPGVIPGECWAFQGFPGFLVIQLSSPIQVTVVTVEHIPQSLAPTGFRDSAPRDFRVWGLRSENDPDPTALGKFRYDVHGAALQYFVVEQQTKAFQLVELIVDSNHGNLNYTCLYRFRVHGTLSLEPT